MKRLDYCTPMTYHKKMELIETPVFKKQIDRLLDELTYAQFKEYLGCDPLKGKLIYWRHLLKRCYYDWT